MGQTLFCKFSAAPEAVALFEKLGVEPWARSATSVLELVAVVLLLLPRVAALGRALTLGLLAGAIVSHVAIIGIDVKNDAGALFAMALVTLLAGGLVTCGRRPDLPLIGTTQR